MWHELQNPWPWYVGGPLIGLFVPLLLLVGNKQLGLSGTLRAICAVLARGRIRFFNYDWKSAGLWNVALAAGLLLGAAISVALSGASTPALSADTQSALVRLGLNPASGLFPRELFNWSALFTPRGAAFLLGGGFLVGFGASYAGGCTSGHGVMGLAARQIASLIALCGIFVGGLLATFLLLPALT